MVLRPQGVGECLAGADRAGVPRGSAATGCLAAGGCPSPAYPAAQAASTVAVEAGFAEARWGALGLSEELEGHREAGKSAIQTRADALRSLLQHEQDLCVFLTD